MYINNRTKIKLRANYRNLSEMKELKNVYQDAALIKKALSGEADERELKELDQRLAESGELQKIYSQLQETENLKVAFDEYKQYSSKEAYQVFLHETQQRELNAPKRNPFRMWWYSAAAVVALAVGVSFYMLNNHLPTDEVLVETALISPGTSQAKLTLPDGSVIDVAKKDVDVVVAGVQVRYKQGVLSYQPTVASQQQLQEQQEQDQQPDEQPISESNQQLVIPRGGENTVILSDGTTVHLNAGSKLTYPVSFRGKSRTVLLEGEAYFDVVRDDKHPFIVQTRFGEITALGTAFNVNAYNDASACYTTLVNGKVSFSTPDRKAVTLSPGEQAVVSAGKVEKRSVNLEEYTGWVSGMYIFNNRSLEEIMQTFERWYDIQVYYETSILRSIKYSGNLKRYGSVNSFLDALELTGDLTYKVNGRKILIYDKTKN